MSFKDYNPKKDIIVDFVPMDLKKKRDRTKITPFVISRNDLYNFVMNDPFVKIKNKRIVIDFPKEN